MAEQGESKPTKAKPKAPPRVTKRVVLRQEKVFVVSGARDLTAEQTKALAAALKAAGIKDTTAHMAWIEVGVFNGASKEDAIEAHAGKPGTPDAKVGTFKAPTVTAFAGGMRLKAPDRPLVQKEAID